VSKAFNLGHTSPLKHHGTPVAQKERFQDAIEDNTEDLEYDLQDSIESTEAVAEDGHLSADEEGDYDLIARTPKRRRLSPSPIRDSSPDDNDMNGPDAGYEYYTADDNDDFHELDTGLDHRATQNPDNFEDLLSSANTILSSPPVQHEPHHRPPGSTAAPRFLFQHNSLSAPSMTAANPPIPSTPSTSRHPPISITATTTPFVKPPRFRAPSPTSQPQPPTEPLPDTFSPQRRGQKFLPGGLAAEVIGWVMNLENSTAAIPPSSTFPSTSTFASTSANARPHSRGRDAVKVLVDEVRGGHAAGMTLVRGRQVHSGGNARLVGSTRSGNDRKWNEQGDVIDHLGVVRIILAGTGTSSSGDAFLRNTNVVEKGKMVRIRQPVWEVVLGGNDDDGETGNQREKWGVAVSWEAVG
jgi:hypothetical protein